MTAFTNIKFSTDIAEARVERPKPRASAPTAASHSRRTSITLLACLCLFITGCAVNQQTRQSLTKYVRASDQIRLTADELLTDYTNRSNAQADRARPKPLLPAPQYPDKFYPAGEPTTIPTAAEWALAETRQALAVIHEYNDLLVALAEGRSEQEVREQTAAFGGALQSLLSIANTTIPGLSFFTEVGGKIIKLAQDAANREQLAKAVVQGREPVATILKHLELQTDAMYDLSVEGTKQKQIAARVAILGAAEPLAALSMLHAPPIDGVIASKMASLQAQAGEVAKSTRTENAVRIPFPFSAGKPVADEAVYTEANIFVQSMRTSAQKYAELVAAQNAYYDVMGKYVAALRETRKSFDVLAESLTAHVDLRTAFSRMLMVAFELRDAVALYRNPPASPVAP